MLEQVILSVKEADLICFLVSARDGLVSEDLDIAKKIRKYKKNILVLVNKVDGLKIESSTSEFYSLGFKNIHAISATNGIGITILIKKYFTTILSKTLQKNYKNSLYPVLFKKEQDRFRFKEDINTIKIAIIGKPNVGKSTLINSILNEKRMITDNMPGTTRDVVWNITSYKNNNYIFIDTAGIRKKNKITNKIEKNSVKQALHVIKLANIIILMLDATEVISDQDIILFNYIINQGCGIMIVFNKYDKISKHDKEKIICSKKLKIMNIGKVHFISAINKLGIDKLFVSINKIFKHSIQQINSFKLTKIMKLAVDKHQPPIIQGHRTKLKYAHLVQRNPLTIIIHGNKLGNLSNSYKKYLSNYFIKHLKIQGNPIHFYFKNNNNPFSKLISK
ncbi:MAG: ribosome biogenesis GTPase Der [Buchnera aphidicola (Melaphis rhois)]